jgi:hypothetical protein
MLLIQDHCIAVHAPASQGAVPRKLYLCHIADVRLRCCWLAGLALHLEPWHCPRQKHTSAVELQQAPLRKAHGAKPGRRRSRLAQHWLSPTSAQHQQAVLDAALGHWSPRQSWYALLQVAARLLLLLPAAAAAAVLLLLLRT